MNYHHLNHRQKPIDLPVGKVICVGRNYADHINELHNPIPTEPVLFMKPDTSLCYLQQPIAIPTYSIDCQHEIELAVLIKEKISHLSEQQIAEKIWGYGLALDLTLRDIQTELKNKGLPWERAKAFDGACPVSYFLPAREILNPNQLDFSLEINAEVKQRGNTAHMLFPIFNLIAYISQYFTILPGDIILTGTPKGVGPLHSGDKLTCRLGNLLTIHSEII